MSNFVGRLGEFPGAGQKAPVATATTAPITLSGSQIIDSVLVTTGDRVLVKDQANAAENAIYTVNSAGPWERSTDFNNQLDIVNGTKVLNAANGFEYFVTFTGIFDPGTTAITWTYTLAGATLSDLTVIGSFTSPGIDDNATGERLQVQDTSILLGDGVTAGEVMTLGMNTVNTGSLLLAGGSSSTFSGGIKLYGSTHATLPGDVLLHSSNNTWMQWDESAGELIFSTGVGVKSPALTLQINDDAQHNGNILLNNNKAIYTESAVGAVGLTLFKFSDDNTYLDASVVGSSLFVRTNGSTIAAGFLPDQVVHLNALRIGDGMVDRVNITGDATSTIFNYTNNGPIIFQSQGTEAFRITDTTLAATFAGIVNVNGTNVDITNVLNPQFRAIDSTNTCTTTLRSEDSEGIIGTNSNHPLAIQTNSTDAINIDTSQNAAFAGNVAVNSGATGNPLFSLQQAGLNRGTFNYLDTGDVLEIDNIIGTGGIELQTSSITRVTIGAVGTTFAGNIIGSAGNEVDSGLFAVKTADESVTNSTTLQDDDDLTITLAGSSYYSFEFFIIATSVSSTPDLKYIINGTVDGNWNAHVFESIGGSTTLVVECWDEAQPTSATQALVANQRSLFRIVGSAQTGVSGGTLKLQWSQNILDAVNATVVKAGSWVRATKMG